MSIFSSGSFGLFPTIDRLRHRPFSWSQPKQGGRVMAGPLHWPSPRTCSAAVDAVVPGDSHCAGFDGYLHKIAIVEAIEVVDINRETLEMLARAPRAHEQASAAAHDALHVEAAFDDGWVVENAFLSVQSAIHEKCCGQDPRQRNKSGVD